jgi:excisionase family DNA binding protein
MNINDEPKVSAEALAAEYSCSAKVFYKLAKEGLPHYRLGRLIRFKRSEVEAFALRREERPESLPRVLDARWCADFGDELDELLSGAA